MTMPVEEALAMIESDPLACALLMSLAKLEETLTELGWDQPPRLMSVMRHLPEGSDEPYTLAIDEVPDVLPIGGGPQIAQRLHNMADAITRRRQRDQSWDRVNVHAWVLCTEGWTASADWDDEAARQQLIRDGERHRVNTRPDRIEVRLLTAVDRSGMSMQVVRFRDGELAATVQQTMPTIQQGATGFRGSVPEALAALMEACQ
jgi:hypothetical protein